MHKIKILLTTLLISGSSSALSQEKNVPPGGGIGGTGYSTETTSKKDLMVNMSTLPQRDCGEDVEIAKLIYHKNNEQNSISSICKGSSIKTDKADYLIIDLNENQLMTIAGKSFISFDKEMELKIGNHLPLFKFNYGNGRIQRKNLNTKNNLYIESHDSIIEINGSDIEINVKNVQIVDSIERKELLIRAYKGSAWIHIEHESLFVAQGYIGTLIIENSNKILSIKKDVGQAGNRIPIRPD